MANVETQHGVLLTTRHLDGMKETCMYPQEVNGCIPYLFMIKYQNIVREVLVSFSYEEYQPPTYYFLLSLSFEIFSIFEGFFEGLSWTCRPFINLTSFQNPSFDCFHLVDLIIVSFMVSFILLKKKYMYLTKECGSDIIFH